MPKLCLEKSGHSVGRPALYGTGDALNGGERRQGNLDSVSDHRLHLISPHEVSDMLVARAKAACHRSAAHTLL
jgi:hypothetical protein